MKCDKFPMNESTPSAKTPNEVAKRTRTRSPNYPSMPLTSALELAKKMWDAQHKHAAHIDSVLSLLGFTSMTGPAGRAVGALAQYGLTKENGAGENRTVALSDLALDYILSTEESAKIKAVRSAALKPPVYAHLWEKFGQFLPNDDTMQKYLVREKNFNPAAVSGVVSDYRATFDFANLSGNVPQEIKTHDDSSDQQPPGGSNPIAGKTESRIQTRSTPPREQPKAPPMTEGLRYLPIPLDIGDAPIPVGMSEDDYQLLLDTLKLWKKKIVRARTWNEIKPAPKRVFPVQAVWKNKDYDKEVTIVSEMGQGADGETYFESEDGTGIPCSELVFPK